MAQGQGLETEPFACIIGLQGFAEQKILMPHTMLAFPVHPRFIGSHHSRQQRLGIEILPYVLRAFMHSEIETHSVACTVSEVPPVLPQRIPGQYIQLASRRTFREYCHGQIYHSAKYQSIVLFFQIRTFPHRDGSGNVGRPEKILAPGIHQIETVRLYYG